MSTSTAFPPRSARTAASEPERPVEHVDVLIVGAGLSGIGTACHLLANCPGKTFTILEARDAIGGTWDLFRYPGIRSDSDMFTLGYSFRPWEEAKAIADGPSILTYIRETARDHGVEDRIRFQHRVVGAEWSSADARWTVAAERTDTGGRDTTARDSGGRNNTRDSGGKATAHSAVVGRRLSYWTAAGLRMTRMPSIWSARTAPNALISCSVW